MGPVKGTAGELKVEISKNAYEHHQLREESAGSNETAQGAVRERSTETGQSSEERTTRGRTLVGVGREGWHGETQEHQSEASVNLPLRWGTGDL